MVDLTRAIARAARRLSSRNRLLAAGRALTLDIRHRILAPQQFGAAETDVLQSLNRHGFCALHDFFTPAECAKLRGNVDDALGRYSDFLKVYGEHDHRMYGVEQVCSAFDDFFHHPLLVRVLQAYTGNFYYGGMCMAARMYATPGNRGSGGGWHRDSAFGRQFKAIAYLSEVDAKHGPFQYIAGSHRTGPYLSMLLRGHQLLDQTRFDDGSYDPLFEEDSNLRTFEAPMGTVILADTRGLHRGKPIEQGNRYALTNYYAVGLQRFAPEKFNMIGRRDVERLGSLDNDVDA